MKNIDEARLESDLAYRFEYLTEFVGLGAEDIERIHGAAEHLGPIVPALVDAVYDKLFTYDATKRHFLSKQSKYDGPVPASLEELTVDHPMIEFRKKHLATYLTRLVTKPYDANMLKYLDTVGSIHTRKTGSKDIHIPLVHMNALMGFVSDAIINTIMGLGLDHDTEVATIRAFNKLLWLQNDLITRHYAE